MKELTLTKNHEGVEVICFTDEGFMFLAEKLKSSVLPSPNTYYAFNKSLKPEDYCYYVNSNGFFKECMGITNNTLTLFINVCYEEYDKLNEQQKESNTGVITSVENYFNHTIKNMSEHDQYRLVEMLASNLGYAVVDNTRIDPKLEEEALIEQLSDLDVFEVDLVKKYIFDVCKRGFTQPTKEQILSFIEDMRKNYNINTPKPNLLKKAADALGYPVTDLKAEPNEINSGLACEYYRVNVTHPISSDQVPYIAECGDIMESLEMTYAEANIFKEIWRSAAERTLGVKKAGNSNKRAAEKVVFFANRYYEQHVNQANITGSRRVNKNK